MDRVVKVALIGMGGYGNGYVREILDESEKHNVECVGMADLYPESCNYLDEVRQKNIPVYSGLEGLYKNHAPDLLIVATPIQFHCRHTCFALEHGSNVMCEKPIAATVLEAEEMKKAAKKAGRFVGIGYQFSYNDAILAIKSDIISGKYGRAVKLKTAMSTRRGLNYYARSWAGKIYDGDSPVYDSVANNACSHYLHNMYFLLGKEINTSAFPKEIEAECYRANDIENYDTITAKIKTTEGVEIYFAATHAAFQNIPPLIYFEFEKGTISFYPQEHMFKGRLAKGEVIEYGNPGSGQYNKVWRAVDAVRGKDTIYCDIDTALAHTHTIDYIQNNVKIIDFPKDIITLENIACENAPVHYMKSVKGLGEKIRLCYDNECMLSEYY